jgi:hypothetical protein
VEEECSRHLVLSQGRVHLVGGEGGVGGLQTGSGGVASA